MTGPIENNWFKQNRQWIIPVAIIIVIGMIAGVIASWINSIGNEGEQKQNNIIALQTRVELDISTCLDSGATAAQVAQQEFTQLKDVLVNVTAARYEGGNGALSQGGPLISALQENYPQIDQSTWRKLSDIVVGCRQDVADSQKRLQDYVADFRTWTTGGGLFETSIRNNYPNELLVTVDRTTGAQLTGKAALDYLSRVISVKAAKDAMKSGELPDQELFPSTPAGK